jgi:CRP/FNR family transcriptional regulator, cyclic AMP receptor protein
MRTIDQLIGDSPTLAGLAPDQLTLIAGCAHNEHIEPETMVAREGSPADVFYMVRKGEVALEMAVPGRDALVIATLGPGEILGWSWLFEPYRWQFDARALGPVEAVSFDGACLRGKCDADHELGYELMRRFAASLLARLQATRLQLMDVYGAPLAR